MKLAVVTVVCCLALADAQGFWGKGKKGSSDTKGGGRFQTFKDKFARPAPPAATGSFGFRFGGKSSRFGPAAKSQSSFMGKFSRFWSLFGARSGAKGYEGVALSKWNRTVDGETESEMAFVDVNRSAIIVRSSQATMYDFGGEDVTAAVRIGWTCYVIPVDANVTYFEEAANEVFERNGTSLGAPSEVVQLDALTATPYNITSPALTQFCQGRQVLEPTQPAAGAIPAEGSLPFWQKVTNVTTLNTKLQILDRTPWSIWIPTAGTKA